VFPRAREQHRDSAASDAHDLGDLCFREIGDETECDCCPLPSWKATHKVPRFTGRAINHDRAPREATKCTLFN
jgi:hypothetical protein